MSTQINPKPFRKITIINGGPRKGWNTATLLGHDVFPQDCVKAQALGARLTRT